MVVPPQSRVDVITGADGLIRVPQLSVTVGATGGDTSPAQLTVADSDGGKLNVGGLTVNVYTQF